MAGLFMPIGSLQRYGGRMSSLSRRIVPAVTGGGGGWSVIASAVASPGSSTTSSINTTGATLILLVVSSETHTPTDSRGNTWTGRTSRAIGVGNLRVWECVAPSVGSGHTFSLPISYGFLAVLALSGNAATPFDSESGQNVAGSGTTAQAGSLTPTQNGCLVIAAVGMGANTGTAATIDAGWNVVGSQQSLSGSYYGGGMAYKIQTTAAAENPTWSWTTATSQRAASLTAYRAA